MVALTGKAAILAAHWDNGRLARCGYAPVGTAFHRRPPRTLRAPNQLANRSRWMASSFADGWNLMAGRMRAPSYVLKVWWKISLVA